jgi:hypothetical protein
VNGKKGNPVELKDHKLEPTTPTPTDLDALAQACAMRVDLARDMQLNEAELIAFAHNRLDIAIMAIRHDSIKISLEYVERAAEALRNAVDLRSVRVERERSARAA